MDKRHLYRWHNKEDGTYKQLDYMMISNKQKNWVTQVRTKGAANPNSDNQHQMLLMKIRIRIKTEQKPQQQRHIQYDIDTLRDNPTTLYEEMSQGKIDSMIYDKDGLAAARAQNNNTFINKWNTRTWKNMEKKLNQNQQHTSPPTDTNPQKRHMGQTKRNMAMKKL